MKAYSGSYENGERNNYVFVQVCTSVGVTVLPYVLHIFSSSVILRSAIKKNKSLNIL